MTIHRPRFTFCWLCALTALAFAAATATPQTPPAAPPAANGAAPAADKDKKLRFEFRDKRWAEVLEWLSEQTGLPVITVQKPTGTFTFVAPKVNGQPREYTIPEIIDIINEALTQQKFMLIRREASFTIVAADEQVDRAILPRVRAEDLATRGKTEMVQTVLQLNALVAEDMVPEVRKMMGPFGEVTALNAANQLLLQDTAGSLIRIIKTIDDIEKNEKGKSDSFSHTCVYVKARDAERMLRDLLGDPRVMIAQAMQAMQQQNRGGGGDGRQPAPVVPMAKFRPYYISSDERLNTVLVTGPADKIAQAREVIKKIDVPQPGQKPVTVGNPVFKTFAVPAGSAADVAKTLQDIYRTSNTVRVTAVGTSSVMVYAPPEDQFDIAQLLNGNGVAGTVTRMIPLTTLQATDVALTLKGMFVDARTGQGPYIEGDSGRNALILKGSADQIADVEAALKAIGEAGGSSNMQIITVDRGSTATLAAELERMISQTRGIPVQVIRPLPPGGATPQAPNQPAPANGNKEKDGGKPATPAPGSGNGGGDTPPQINDPQQQPQGTPPANPNAKPLTITAVGNKIILNSEDPATLAYARELVRLLTQPGADGGDFEVIRLKKANATDAARVIDELFNGKPQPQQGGGGGGNPFAGGRFNPFQMQMGNQGGGAAAAATNKVRVVADPSSNTLLVRASPVEMITIKNLIKNSIDADEDVTGTQKAHKIGPLKSANAAEVAQVIQTVYRDLTGADSRGGIVGGFPGFGFGAFGRNAVNSRGTDANGQNRPNPLSIGVDERSNSLYVLCSEALFRDIEKLVDELEKDATGSSQTVKIIPIKGIDPAMVQDVIDAISGQRSTPNRPGMGGPGGMGNFGGGQGNFGGNRFGGGMGNFGGGQGNFGGGQGNFGGGRFGGGQGNFGGGQGNFGGGQGNFGGNRGGVGGVMPAGGGGGGGNRGGGGRAGPNGRAPDRESRGPDFFEQGVMDDPKASQLFDPQTSQTVAQNLMSFEEQQQQPAPPAGAPQAQPNQPQPNQPNQPAQPGEIRAPRRPVTAQPLTELGVIVLRGENQADIKEVLEVIELLQKIGAGSEVAIELVQLKAADATSVTNILTQVYQRVQATPSGNILAGGGAAQQRPPQAGFFGQQQAAVIQQPSNMLMIPLPRTNSILVAAARARIPEIRKEIDKLDVPSLTSGRATPFQLKKAAAQTVANFITQLYQQRFPNETTTQNQIRVTFDTSTNTVFVQAAPADLEEIKELIDRLDSTVSAAINDLRIIKLRNALADEMSNTIVQAITQGVAAPGTTATAPGQFPGFGLPGQQRPATPAAPTAAGVTTKTTSLRFFARPGLGGTVEAGVLEDVHITPDIRSNSLIVSAPSRTMDLLVALINQLDVPAAAQAGVNIFTLKKADAVQTANLIQQMFTGSGGARPATTGAAAFTPAAAVAAAGGGRTTITLAGNPTDGATLIDLRISVDDRTNSIIVAGSRNDLDVIEAVIARLEDANVEGRRNTVVKIRNVSAADVATALQTFVNNSLTVYSTGGALTSFQEIQRNVVIVPEAVSNTLLISATPKYFAELMAMIDELDAMPPQVVIQVLVAEVTFNDNQELGVEMGLQSPVLFWRGILPGFSASSANTNAAIPGFNFNTTTPLGTPALGNSALVNPPTVGFQGLGNLGVNRVSPTSGVGGFVFSASSDSFNLLIRALKAQDRLDVLSRPQVMTLDNQTAAVNIGQDFPIIGNTTITGTGLATTDVIRRNIGILLRVTPRITPDGKVLMRVFPEVSSVGQTVQLSTNVVSQAFNIQQVETTVVGQDGETIVIGGLIAQRDKKTETKVPWVGDLPYIGAAFRYRTQVRQKTELLVILTPHIVRNQADADRIMCEEAKRMDWILKDVAKIHASPGLRPPEMPSVPTPMVFPQMEPGFVTDGSIIPGMPTGPTMPTPPTAPSQPFPTPPPTTPTNPPVSPPPVITPSNGEAPTGPGLLPANFNGQAPPPDQPPKKESRAWKLFKKD